MLQRGSQKLLYLTSEGSVKVLHVFTFHVQPSVAVRRQFSRPPFKPSKFVQRSFLFQSLASLYSLEGGEFATSPDGDGVRRWEDNRSRTLCTLETNAWMPLCVRKRQPNAAVLGQGCFHSLSLDSTSHGWRQHHPLTSQTPIR